MKIFLEQQNAVVEIDDADLPIFSAHRWTILRRGKTRYADTKIDGRHVYLHQLLLVAPDGKVIDHRDGNGLNCRRDNLRPATRRQNTWNRHVLEVAFRDNYWHTAMRVDGGRIHLGFFPDEATAHQARAYVAARLRGEFAPDNGIDVTGFDPLLLTPTARKLLARGGACDPLPYQ